MIGLDSPVSATKLTLGHRVGFISSHLTADKLFPVNSREITGPPKMSLLLEAKCMPALIIKPRFTLVTHTDDLGWYITSNQQGQMFVQNLNRIFSEPNVAPGQILYCTHTSPKPLLVHLAYAATQGITTNKHNLSCSVNS